MLVTEALVFAAGIFEKVPEIMAQSKIILDVGTIGYCHDLYSLKMRDFDASMSGRFYLSHDNTGLYQLYLVQKEIVIYKTEKECVWKARYYLINESERKETEKNGRDRAMTNRTWQNRFETIVQHFSIQTNRLSELKSY